MADAHSNLDHLLKPLPLLLPPDLEEILQGRGYGVDGPMDDPKYRCLALVLTMAYHQASSGKGKERHANDDRFESQLIVQLGHLMGDRTEGNIFQACKKAVESLRLPRERAVAELLGAINYLAGAVLILEAAPDKKETK